MLSLKKIKRGQTDRLNSQLLCGQTTKREYMILKYRWRNGKKKYNREQADHLSSQWLHGRVTYENYQANISCQGKI